MMGIYSCIMHFEGSCLSAKIFHIQLEALCNKVYTLSNYILCFFFAPKPNYVRVLLFPVQGSRNKEYNSA